MGVPVALKGHQHVCPLPKHVGGPIKEGHPGLTVNGIPVALVGHQCECKTGGPDIIAVGNPLLTVNGIPVAVMGSQTIHGGVVIQGDPGLIIG
ncbi:hypothetical protein M988_1024 [Hafnia paralvei ATCC 29927]|uniref:PAAR domain-containing protein n=1 Tax=Hafnia paralvei TaxID=546367 RepID=UPI0007E44F0D|nr:PAAR domain-containing protein [Hafnia paralvei]MDU1192137.1 PAAR domain-containing protein [Enterobacteriaceae bacterium]MBW2956284.1 PAAR domain-containing protein [Hafnia paralvei]MBW2956854.1 PAAR domain-containing protein [Hafnia paralvei]MCQ4169802.1 PAAR domain-containing protein [Hafnia paralvei]MDU1244040.1 PAAR domain-containing protein [Enterobacteriaceae bacterium]